MEENMRQDNGDVKYQSQYRLRKLCELIDLSEQC